MRWKRIKGRVLAAGILLLFVTVCSPSAYAEGDTVVLVDHRPVGAWTDGEGLVCVDLNAFCRAAAGPVFMRQEGEEVTVGTPYLTITARQGDRYISANGQTFYCGEKGAVELRGGACYVPLEPLVRLFDAEVDAGDCKLAVATGRRRADFTSAMAQYDDEELYWLSRIISAEARGESLEGKLAVGNVVLNRVRSALYPDNVYDVIFDTKFGVQFSPVANGSVYNEPTEESVLAARLVLDGAVLTDSALFFENEALAASGWISRTRQYLFTLGNHVFYA